MDMMDQRRRILLNPPRIETASGASLSLTSAEAAPMQGCTVNFLPVQSGSGDPSPSNIRNLSGWTGVNLTISPTQQAADGTTYAASWTVQGAAYRGYVNLVTGLLTVTWGYLLYTGADGEAWNIESGDNLYIMTPSTFYRDTNSERLICNMALSRIALSTGTCKITSTGNFNIKIGSLINISTVSAFKTWLSTHNLQVACQLNTAQTYQLTGQQIRTLQGKNNISTNANGDISATYWTH